MTAITPKRSPKGTRLYSHADVERLRRIQEMTAELGMNLAGVERVFELEDKLTRLQRKVDALENPRYAILGMAMVCNEAHPIKQVLNEIVNALRAHPVAEFVDFEMEV